jgi:hypothetical protein
MPTCARDHAQPKATIRTSVASDGDEDEEEEKIKRKVAKRVQVVQEILKTEET